jgi:metal-responsive CopG/Arc/MetJ family transcriptional regulator
MRNTQQQLESISIKITKTLSARVSKLAKSRNVSRTEIVRDALEAYTQKTRVSFTSSVGDLRGCLKHLPSDLSSNPKYLKGYGE